MSLADDIREAFSIIGAPVVVALSGGADSAVAAWASAEAGLTARAVHVDHRLAGSEMMRAAAEEVARAVGIDLVVVRVEPRTSAEADLRDARYAGLAGALIAGETLVTAHTSDDQAETVLLNLLRGSGLPGLAGIPRRRGRIVRPMLDFTRSEIREVARQWRLPFADDPENQTTDHLRNRVRLELIPELETGFNPAIRRVLARTADVVGEALVPMQQAASRIPCEVLGRSVRVAIGPLLAAEAPVRRWVLRSIMSHARGPYPPSREEVERVEAALLSGHGIDVADTDLRFDVCGPWLELTPGDPSRPEPVTLEESARWGPFRFRTGDWHGGPRLSKWRFVHPPGHYTVRAVEPGDEIRITTGSKDAREAIREAGLDPRAWPVVVDAAGVILWIPGARHAAWSPDASSGYFETLAEEDAGWAPFQL